MEVKVKDIVHARKTLEELTEESLPARAAFQIALLVKRLQPVLQAFEERRVAVIKEFGEQVENGDWQVPEEKMSEADERMGEIGEESVRLEFSPIKIDLFQDISIKPAHLVRLAPFLEDENAK